MASVLERMSFRDSLGADAYRASATGAAVQARGWSAVLLHVGCSAYGDGRHEIAVQAATDDGNGKPGRFVDVDADGLERRPPVIESAHDAGKSWWFRYVGDAEWIRAVVRVSGATQGAKYHVSILRERAEA